MASMNDVARLAKVAKSTVSLVLNNTGYVSEETRKRVEAAMEELNYKPSELARNFSKNRSNIIGVIIPDIAHPFFGSFVKYLEQSLYEKGYKTMVCGTIKRQNAEEEYLNMLERHIMDGVIMGGHTLEVERYRHIKKPIVTLDRYLNEAIPMVKADHKLGGRMAAEVMLKNKRSKIVQITGAKTVNTPAHEYHSVFAEVLRAQGLIVDDIEMGHNLFEMKDFERTAAELFDQYPETDGILGADMAVIACMKEAKKRGIKIPEALQLIAYDGTYITRMGDSVVTSIVQPVEQLAETAAEMIQQMVEKDNKLGSLIKELPVTFQQGDTTL